MARIFVSYKRDDLKKVKPLIDEIERRTGEKCWYDLDGIETSVQFASVICSAIDSADIVLFLHSRNHLGIDFQNDWTVRELTYAHESKKRVVLIKLDNTPLRNIFQMFYGGTNNVKINDPIQKEKLFRDLNSWLKKKEEKLEPVQPQPPFHRRKWFWPAISGVFATFVIIAGVLLGGGSKTTEPKPENPNGAEISTPTTPATPVEPAKPTVIEVQSLSLNKTTLTLMEGETATLIVTVKPTNATDKKVTWKSTNSKVATVSSSGKITTKTPGNTSIIAQCGGKEVSCDIVVKEKPAPEPTTVAVQSISLSNESLTLTVGDTKTLNVTFTPSNATDKSVKWESANSGVASVYYNGLVTAKAAGTTTITASVGGKKAVCKITVKELQQSNAIIEQPQPPQPTTIEVQSISLSNTSLTLTVGDTKTLNVTFTPSNATDKSVKWESANPGVASVNNNGLVTAKAAGTTIITASVGGKWRGISCEITVNKEISDGAVDLGIIMTRADGTTYNLYWAKSNLCERGLCANPEDYGDYYAWGETAPKSEYSLTSYKFRTSGNTYNNVKFSKYNTSRKYGTVDGKTVLDPWDDAARVKLGGKWRIPTRAEWEMLRSECTWILTTKNGAKGYRVTAPNGNSIFLPAAGDRYGTSLHNAGSRGEYWSSSLYTDGPDYAWGVGFDSSHVYNIFSVRYDGQSVRPVTE